MVKGFEDETGEWTTLDAFARSGGTTARNVRALQSAGVLPPPSMRGRTGYYGSEHRRRLHAVLDLQEQGFTLGALRTLLEAWARGATLEEVLGLPSRSPRARSQDPEPLDPVEEFFGRCHPRQGFLSAVPSPLLAGWADKAS